MGVDSLYHTSRGVVAKSEKEGPIKNRFEIQQNKIIQGITKETSRRSVILFMG